MAALSQLLVALSLLVIVQWSLAVPTSTERAKRWGSCPNPECKGAKGARGDRGPRGPQGYTGMRGPPGYCSAKVCYDFVKEHLPKGDGPPIQGDPGTEGPPGPPGPEGPQGPIGPKGMIGPQGPMGDPGLPGDPGEEGTPGRKGFPGMKGEPGVPGEQGPQGDSGSKGIPGSNGEPGAPGQKGEPGNRGSKGIPGMDGIPGEKGNPGSKGIPGTPGQDGPKGEPGKDGEKGMKGEKGDPGPPIEVIPRGDSGPCTVELQGTIRFDPNTSELYFCNGTQWICIVSQMCGGTQPPPTCPSPFGPQQIGSIWYQVFTENIVHETQDAADIVLLIDDSGSMTLEHAWLTVMVPLLEEMLTEAGVGNKEVKNRYCALSFGTLTREIEFLHDPHCFPASRYINASENLRNTGFEEDGYQAIEFAINNIDLRNGPFIAKNFILITDEGRTPLTNTTKEQIANLLQMNNILLNVVVWANLELPSSPDAVVMGVDHNGVSYIVEPNGTFSTTNETLNVTSADKDTEEVYYDLALSIGGAAWSLPVLRESSLTSNQTLQQSFTTALTDLKVREIRTVIESCRQCVCLMGDEGGARVSCTTATDQDFCKCVVASNGDTAFCAR